MSFHASSENVELRDGHILVGQCKDEEGNFQESIIDLDTFIGNSDGWFKWDGENFSHSSNDISLSFRPDGIYLEGELACADGSYRERQGVNLSDRISNENGQLIYVG